MTGKKERVVDSQHVYRGRAIHVRVDSVVKPNEKKTTREVVEHVDCVVILPIDSNGNILLVRQYRHAVDKELLELPAGSIDPGETPLQAAEVETLLREALPEEDAAHVSGQSQRSASGLRGCADGDPRRA